MAELYKDENSPPFGGEPINQFDEMQLAPFLPYQLELFCDQIVTEEQLYREIQITRHILTRLELFEYDGKRVLAKDKKMLVIKFTQLFRALLFMKSKCKEYDLYA